MPGEIICIGDELMSGRSADLNSRHAAVRLGALGLMLTSITTIGDDTAAIGQVLRLALSRSDFVIISGGLGPTEDDITAEAAAQALGLPMEENRPMLVNLEALAAGHGRKLNPGARRMAWLPQGAKVLDPSCAGFLLPAPQGQPLFFLPGVPYEFRMLIDGPVGSYLAQRFLEGVVTTRMLRTFGLLESEIGARLEGLADNWPGARLGYYPTFPEEKILVSVRAAAKDQAEAIADEVLSEVERRLAPHVIARGATTLAQAVAALLTEQDLTLALAESCTGGLIGHRLTQVAGSSVFFERGLVVYSNRAKQELLGVSGETLERFGAVSAQCARQMAMGARERAGTDLGLAVTGIAGPGGGSADKPVGTVFLALADGQNVRVEGKRLSGDRTMIKSLTAELALVWLLRYGQDHAFICGA